MKGLLAKRTLNMICGLCNRYKREDAKIQAWENHEKAKAEAEMRRIEVCSNQNIKCKD
jgi:hypothetical protein